MSQLLEHEFGVPPDRALAAVKEAADLWGAFWQPDGHGGQLALPVVQGLRRGVWDVRIRAQSIPSGTSLQLAVMSSRVHLHRSAVAVLLLGAFGGVTVVLWPVFPSLLPLAPAGAVLALVAWLLVVSRLRSKGTEDFLDLLVAVLEEGPDGGRGNVSTPSRR